MKVLILALCFCLAVAERSDLMEDLERLLSADSKSHTKSNSDPPEISILKNLDELDALSQDEKEPEPAADSTPGKYGLCMDGETFAEGPSMRGCARKVCYDETPGGCNRLFRGKNTMERKKICYGDYFHYRERCPYSCGFCRGKPPSPAKECAKRYGNRAPHGCCWDGIPALRADKSDCMVCRDSTPHTCRQFYNNMFGEKCGTNSYRIRRFLYSRCPQTCGKCS